MRWILYNVLFAFGFGLALPRYLLRMRKRGGYRRGFLQRFGLYAPETLRKLAARPRVWIHAVSVGEIQVALCFMAEMRRVEPDAAFVLTTNTPTAWRIGSEAVSDEDVLLYFPVDFPCIMKRVLRLLRPPALILTEKEVWPNLIRACRARSIPVFLINGRMSEASAAGYRKLRGFFAPVVRSLTLALVQSEADRSRLIGLGARPERTVVVGSAKYDGALGAAPARERAQALLARAGAGKGAIVLLGGSTWPGEETALCEIVRTLRARQPRLRLALVPRHAERRADVARDVAKTGLTPVLRSLLDAADSRPGPETVKAADTVLIVDSTGELADFYACADIVFVGKSLGRNRGGQNIIEPACLGKPVVTGPHMENFPVVMDDFLAARAVTQVADAEGLSRTIEVWLADENVRQNQGRRARAVVEAKRGCVRVSVEKILDHLLQDQCRS